MKNKRGWAKDVTNMGNCKYLDYFDEGNLQGWISENANKTFSYFHHETRNNALGIKFFEMPKDYQMIVLKYLIKRI